MLDELEPTTDRQNTTGGSAGAGGYSFQAEACAAVAAKILAAEPLNWGTQGGTGVPIVLLAETGKGGDDLSIHLESGAVLEVQAKERVQTGKKFWEAFLALARAVNAAPNVYGVLLTDSRASMTIRNDLKRDIVRVGSGRQDQLKPITKQFLDRLGKSRVRDVSACCARLQIITRDFEPGSNGEEQIRATLSKVVLDANRVINAHDALAKDGQRLTIERGQRNKAHIEGLLADRGIAISAPLVGPRGPLQEIFDQFTQLSATVAKTNNEGIQAQEKLLIADTDALAAKLRASWASREFEAAFATAAELGRWLAANSPRLSGDAAADAYVLLVEIEISRLSIGNKGLAAESVAYLSDLLRDGELAASRTVATAAEGTRQRLLSLKALLKSHAHGTEAGLELLAGRDDPFAVRRRLAILINAGEFDAATKVVDANDLHAEFADKAAAVLGAVGRYSDAREVIVWAKRQIDAPFLALACSVESADAACRGIFRVGQEELDGALMPSTPARRSQLEGAMCLLAETTDAVKAFGRIRSHLEMSALWREAVILAYLSNSDALGTAVSVLETWKPLPWVLLDLVQHELWPASPDWSERLTAEYPGDIDIEILAAIIARDDPESRERDFERLLELAWSATSGGATPGSKGALYERMSNIAPKLGGDAIAKLDAVESDLIGDDPARRETIRLVRLVNTGQFAEAAELLDAAPERDDYVWLQCRAAVEAYRGKPADAFILLKRALAEFKSSHLLLLAADVAIQSGEKAEGTDLLEQYVEVRPADEAARQRLAFLLVEQTDFIRAGRHFEVLWNADTHDPRRAINYASTLVHTGDLEKSLIVYAAACTGQPPNLQALLARSAVLKGLGRPKEAFDKLIQVRDQFWDEPNYLMAVADLGWASQEEATAAEALARIRELQSEGKADTDLLRTFTVDEAVEMFADRRRLSEDAQGYVLRGQLPWITVDRMLNESAIGGWSNRTRSRDWIGEMPYAQAITAVYATNSFFIDRRLDRTRAFRRLPLPPKGSPVVADLSALITLQALGLLDVAAQFFGTIYIPSTYYPIALEEAGKLVLHQPSQRSELEAIREAIESGHISVSETANELGSRFAEYEESVAEAECQSYGLADLLPVMESLGLISEKQARDGAQRCHRAAALPPPAAYTTVAADLPSLKLCASAELLTPLLEAFRVVISNHEWNSLNAGVRSYRLQTKLHESHQRLWEHIHSDSRFVTLPYMTKVALPADEEPDLRRASDIAAPLLARDRGLWLLADDRACQGLIYGDPQSPPGCYALGTDRLLSSLAIVGIVDSEAGADAYMQLIRWRYRFLVPPSSLLRTLAKRHQNHPPGRELRDIATYAHDCMRDAGLPVEQASGAPTSTVANWLFIEWIQTVVEFACLMWTDGSVPVGQAELWTEWAIRSMLPSPPRSVGQFGMTSLPIGVDFAKHVLAHAVARLFAAKDRGKARRALGVIATALGVPAEEHTRMISEALND